ncbi:MAG: tRNA (adenosine(37)-N6)-threonylcarbamoyltransferase complex transferase subunit TsaD, partial [bacterium]|nr:tRNA (adenosine(37)-N6)-threonylcarbamoyltransferase complex transferase subunit TsaD [bacterium]
PASNAKRSFAGWPNFRILSNVVSSQIKVHEKYGGVYPQMAKREHIVNLPLTLAAALKQAKLKETNPGIDAISVTYGPGLSPCLWTGINFAKELAKKYNVPLIPADHMEGHLLVGLFTGLPKLSLGAPKLSLGRLFPATVLLVSGGHTQLLLMQGIGEYKLLGETRDDAAGEAFDKTARILGFSYPGGPKLAALPKLSLGAPKLSLGIKLPRPMLSTRDFDFSFSGLKTAVLYDYQKRTKKVRESKEYIRAMAKEIEQSIIDVLVRKTLRAQEQYSAKSVILGGGVCENNELRTQLACELAKEKVALFLPKKSLATDNGIMPALVGYFQYQKNKYPKNSESIVAQPNLQLDDPS